MKLKFMNVCIYVFPCRGEDVKSSSYFFLVRTSVHLNLARATCDDKDGGVSLLACNKRGLSSLRDCSKPNKADNSLMPFLLLQVRLCWLW
jgi:hypothetical protein